jgi:dTDP-4-dehydrorhamnose reductase
MYNNCLVLGGNGYLGSSLVKHGVHRGWDITIGTKDNFNVLKNIKWDLVINANGNSKKYLATKDPGLDFKLSVESVMASLFELKFDQYIYISSSNVYNSPFENNDEESDIYPLLLSQYGFHKWIAEQLVKKNASNWLILRGGGFVGPNIKKNPIYDLLTGNPLFVHPNSCFQFMSTENFADVVFTFLERGKLPNDIYNISGRNTTKLIDIINYMGLDSSKFNTELPIETYHINTKKLEVYLAKNGRPLLDSTVVVKQFVDDVKAGRITL